ncbi:Calx-beta domain-containing protein [Xenococcus sp. PCC 7305]|uniref:Calx-beta domain-containing protein n=1 Tax=Xenococcus sp. PCC 7305 TaxID=102125 RepID=UPI0002ABEF5E|nr:Calx-beta domain-containing protein [Xenococcus sp. PCC 7305]ELS05170.1 Calx-beta domain-containing protein [Xenococcus sp. PCC 7305]
MEESSIIVIGIEALRVQEDIGKAIIPIIRTGNIDITSSVDYSINGNVARSGQDFISISDTLIFAPGDTEQEITVDIIDDSIFETDESFSLAIGNPTGAVLGDIRTAIVTIEDDDVISENTLAFSQAEYSISEAENIATITITNVSSTKI